MCARPPDRSKLLAHDAFHSMTGRLLTVEAVDGSTHQVLSTTGLHMLVAFQACSFLRYFLGVRVHCRPRIRHNRFVKTFARAPHGKSIGARIVAVLFLLAWHLWIASHVPLETSTSVKSSGLLAVGCNNCFRTIDTKLCGCVSNIHHKSGSANSLLPLLCVQEVSC